MPIPQLDTANCLPRDELNGPRKSSVSDERNSHDAKGRYRPEQHKHRGGDRQQRHLPIASLLDEVRYFSEKEDRLGLEMHRTEEAISRAEYAETQLKEAFDKLTEAEEARSQSEIHSIRVQEDLHRQKEQVARLQQELREAQIQIERLQQEKSASEIEVEKIRAAKTALQSKFRSYQAKEEGREEGLKSGMLKQFQENRQYVWEAGFSDGFEEGKAAGSKEGTRKGRKEGVREGREQGRREERRNALEAFDRFIKEEREGEGDRTRRWTESVYYTESH
ncbi:hypothetical protein J3R30DRAFT_1761304 [Lentinula aciculospora]|uniref:Uncharacterized protein n=1 Tax=Lentinula aciculospora TaxID=153920 RepID=A0A9W9AID4_9AGAR|nr:hypothetical protein J3R30DRAFT_1761304 [Lentinula aciculospora]